MIKVMIKTPLVPWGLLSLEKSGGTSEDNNP